MKKILAVVVFSFVFLGLASISAAYSIRDDETGGDCSCIGMWDWATKTCVLTTDVYDTIYIDGDSIILDGNSHSVIGKGKFQLCGGEGIFLYDRTGVIIKNFNIRGFSNGIYLTGIGASNNIISANAVSENCGNGILVNPFTHDNSIIGNMATDNGIGIFVANSSNIEIAANTVTNNYSGIVVLLSNDSTIEANAVRNNSNYGIAIFSSNNNLLIDNNVSEGHYSAIELQYSSNNILQGNIVSNNSHGGIAIWAYSENNTVENNTISNNEYGIFLNSSNSNKVINNNFIDNSLQANSRGSINIFNLDAPIGGNYWSDFDEPSEGCYDANNDGFCDSPYVCDIPYVCGNTDYLPWTKQDGWLQTPGVLTNNVITTVGELLISGEITNQGIADSLTDKLQDVLNALNQGDTQTAENILHAFVNQVEALSGKKIAADAALDLIGAVEQILRKL
jgi:parallel beta-helix repeat protein